MDVLSWGRRDFQISFSNRDTSRNAWNRHWGSFMVDTGILSNNMNFPLTNVKLHSVTWPYTMTTPTDQTLYRTRPFTEFWVVSMEHLRRVWHADRGRLLLRTPGPVPLGLAYVLLVETNLFPNLSLFYRTMLFEFSILLNSQDACVISLMLLVDRNGIYFRRLRIFVKVPEIGVGSHKNSYLIDNVCYMPYNSDDVTSLTTRHSNIT